MYKELLTAISILYLFILLGKAKYALREKSPSGVKY